ncbi:hypothetical protein BDF22DRAFT_675780 [Syncephalis plumigaleata]|nr:hypothetical protein BDF22DRAFT_675780 [Syncephalis plumigaleata]
MFSFYLRTMQSLPELVLERIATYAEPDSLVILASCCRQLWLYISRQQSIWEQQYRMRYSLLDDQEAKWMSWHMKANAALSKQTVNTISDKRGIRRKCHTCINWFYAFCQRSATDKHWFKNDPKQLQDVKTNDMSDIHVDVLQRIVHHNKTIDECQIIEQCQPYNNAMVNDRFWRLRKPYYTDIDADTILKNVILSSLFLIAFITHPGTSSNKSRLSEEILAWPVHRASNLKPRRLAYRYNNNLNVIDRWMQFNYYEKITSEDDDPGISTVYVLDLATGRACSNTFSGFISKSFLQRVDNNKAIVFQASLTRHHNEGIVHWSVWQFSTSQTGMTSRCIVDGRFSIGKSDNTIPPTQRLDDNRVLVRCDTKQVTKSSTIGDDNDNDDDQIYTLAVISTCYDESNEFVHNPPPIWSHNIPIELAKPFVMLNRVLVMSDEGWTTYSLIDGSVLSFTSMKIIVPILQRYCARLTIHDYLNNISCYLPRYILCASTDNKSYVAVDLLHPERTGQLRIAHIFEYYNTYSPDTVFMEDTTDQQDYLRLRRVILSIEKKLRIQIRTRNVLLVRYKDEYKIVDLSI